nr:aquaporin-2 [Quercus suber]
MVVDTCVPAGILSPSTPKKSRIYRSFPDTHESSPGKRKVFRLWITRTREPQNKTELRLAETTKEAPLSMATMDKPYATVRTSVRRSSRRKKPSAIRKHFVAASGEFVGTFLFLFLAFCGHTMAAQQASDTGPNGTTSSSTVIYISLAYGFSLLITAWTLYRVSGGLFNPAVTLGMVITKSLPAVRGLCLLPAQILGAICAAAVVSCILPGPIAITQTTLAPGVSVVQGMFLEMFLTANLVFAVLMLAAEKSKDTFVSVGSCSNVGFADVHLQMAPIGIGIALFVAELAGVYYTGGSLNPARSFGPCVAAASFQHYHWIYWIGPFLGALVAAGYYSFVKFLNYEEANPGQDSAGADERDG